MSEINESSIDRSILGDLSVSAEIDKTTLPIKALLAINGLGLVFEWGTGNETLLGLVGGEVFKHTSNVLLTTAATSGASMAEQTTLGLITALTIEKYPKAVDIIKDKISRFEKGKNPKQKEGLFGRFTTAFALGTSVKLIKDNYHERRSYGENTIKALADSALIGAGVAAIAGVSSGVTEIGKQSGLVTEAHYAVDVVTSPITYVGLFGAYIFQKRRQRRLDAKNPLYKERDIESTDKETQISVGIELNGNDRETVWNMINEGFIDLNNKSYDRQNMTRDEFDADCDSWDVLKFVARDGKGDITGFLNVHVGLDDISWVNTKKLKSEQAKVDKKAKSYYIGSIVVPVDKRGTEVARNLLRSAYDQFQHVNRELGKDSLCFFDIAEANYPMISIFAERAAKQTASYPGIGIHIREIYCNAWVKTDNNTEAILVDEETAITNNYHILDKIHVFAVSVDKQ